MQDCAIFAMLLPERERSPLRGSDLAKREPSPLLTTTSRCIVAHGRVRGASHRYGHVGLGQQL